MVRDALGLPEETELEKEYRERAAEIQAENEARRLALENGEEE